MPDSAAFDLDALERWMLAAITHPQGLGAADPAEIERVVTPSRAMDATQRLDVYARCYFWRLIETMAGEYPTTRQVLGADRFEELCRAYLAAHPPRSWTLNDLSSAFASYLAQEAPDVPHRAAVADIARIERAMEEVFDDARRAPIGTDDLLAIPQARWPDVRLALIPALRLIALAHPVDACITAVREGHPPELPDPTPAWVAVWRSDYRVWRRPLTRAQFSLLRALRSGLPLGGALEACAALPDIDLPALVEQLRGWFRDWAAEGWFCSVD